MAEYNVLDCAPSTLPNTGSRKFCYEDLKSIYNMILTPFDYEFTDSSTALTESNWQTQIESLTDRFYPLAPVYMIEDQSEEAAFEEFPVRGKLQVSDGKLQGKFWIRAPKYWRNNMSDFQNLQWRIWFIDEEGKLMGTAEDPTDNTTATKGLLASIFIDNDRIFQDGTLSGDLVPVVVVLEDVQEWKENGVILQPLNESTSWNPKNLDGLIDADVTVDSAAAALIVVTVTARYSSDLISGFGTATANWVKTGAGTITSVVDNGDGTYNLVAAGADFATGTINLAAASVLSLDGFEAGDAATVTI